jgi:outer membrane protein
MRNLTKNMLGATLIAAATLMGTHTVVLAADTVQPASIIVIDMQLVQQNSLAGKDVLRQLNDVKTSIQDEMQKEQTQLRSEQDELQRQRAILTPEAFDQKRQAFEQKVMDFQRKVQEKNAQLEAAYQKAQGVMQRALVPILQKELKLKNATLLLDKSVILQLAPDRGLDVTTEVTEQLDSVLPGLKVDLTTVSDTSLGAKPAAPAPAPAPAANSKKKK